MCGIVGVLGNIPSKNKIKKARDVLEHRGPDNAGLYYDKQENIALAHRRLSIIDLSSAGIQPFFSNDKRYIIIYNGEIYNYLELKNELADFYNFKTKTDTEVLLAAYIKWGYKCLDKLNGMFAFAIWDKEKKELFCARDRLGIKPLFYTTIRKTFIFASEIKALLALGAKKEPNENIIFDYLYYGFYDHSDETFFKGIKRFPQAHYMILKDNQIKIKKYWDLTDNGNKKLQLSKKQVQKKFKELLADSIKLRFRSDVPVGVNLSSGLDSNSLLHYAYKAVGTKEISSFSICTESKEYDECALINNYLDNEQKKLWHRSFLTPNEVFPLAIQMNKIQDQPFGGVPTIAYAKLNEKAKEKEVTVLLEGQGLDELLAGYKYYEIEYKKDLGQKSNDDSIGRSQDATKLIGSEIMDKSFIKSKKRKLSFKAPFSSHLLNAQYRDIMYTKIPRVLRFNDHISMAYSRELRLPFLDHRIVEFCFHLPSKYKINSGVQKSLMREIMKDYLPDIVNKKPKKAFTAVQVEWFKNHNKNEILAILNSSSFRKRKYWDYKKLMQAIGHFFEGKIDNSFFIWQCINLEMWLKKYIDHI